MTRILVTSDWHPDATTAGFPRLNDVRAAVEETVRVAVEEHVDLYLFLGDLADPDDVRSHAALEIALWAAVYLAERGIPSRWLQGNHDALEDGSNGSTLQALDGLARGRTNSRILTHREPGFEVCCAGLPIDLVALPYTPRSHPYDPAAFVRGLPPELGGNGLRRVIVAGHLNLEGIAPGSESLEMPRGRDVFFPIDAVLERFGDQAVMLNGHIHQQQTYRGVRLPGSLEKLTFGDGDGAPGFLLVEVDDGA